MRKIGYIYEYSEEEKKGIIIFNSSKAIITPLLFPETNCKTSVSKNNLVFFDFDNNTALNIEQVSLSSFDKTLVVDMITEGVNDVSDSIIEDDWWYYNKTHFKYDDVHFMYVIDSIFNSELNQPKSIDELFELCRKWLYSYCDSFYNIDILDLNLWMGKDYDIQNCFGKNMEEAIFLYNVFVEKKYISKHGEWCCRTESNRVLSSVWNDIINCMSVDDLKMLIKRAPLLQPLLPEDFCKENIQLLSVDNRMPNETVCRLVCENHINNIRKIEEYEYMKELLTRYKNSDTYETKETGVPMEAMKKKTISVLMKRLDRQFNKFIQPNIIDYYGKISGKYCIENSSELETFTNDELFLLGKIIITDEMLISEIPFGNLYSKKILEVFEDLPEDRKSVVKPYVKAQFNEMLLKYSAIVKPSASCFNIWLNYLSGWISESVFEQIKANVNTSFSKLDDLEQLKEAYVVALITDEQYLSRYKKLTSKFDACQIESEIFSDYQFCKTVYPLSVLKYLVIKFISFFDYNSLDSYEPIRYGDRYSQCICNIRELLKWIEENVGCNYNDNSICDEAKRLIIDKLTLDEKFILLEENVISNLDADLLIEKFRKSVHNTTLGEKIFKQKCFQDIMLNALRKSEDYTIEEQKYIYDNLDLLNHDKVSEDIDDCLKLYIFLNGSRESVDIDIILNHMSKFDNEEQCLLLKYIFSLLAKGECKYTFNELYYELISSKKRQVCQAVICILKLIKEVVTNGIISNKSRKIKELVGNSYNDKFIEESNMLEFFTKCRGYIAFSEIPLCKVYHISSIIPLNREDGEYGYINERIIGDKTFFVFSIKDVKPTNYYSLDIDEMDRVNQIEENNYLLRDTIEQNLPYKKINDEYWIESSFEYEVKELAIRFMMRDDCGLFSCDTQGNELHNCLRVTYEESPYNICKCCNCRAISPVEGIPFKWCDKKICAKTSQYLISTMRWKSYTVYDFLYILLGSDRQKLDIVRKYQSEIIQCIMPNAEFDNDVSEWSENMSLIRESIHSTYMEADCDPDDSCEENRYDDWPEEPTYERYRGSYAQDEMGYSDDDIDTIFDGNPDAYWNID